MGTGGNQGTSGDKDAELQYPLLEGLGVLPHVLSLAGGMSAIRPSTEGSN